MAKKITAAAKARASHFDVIVVGGGPAGMMAAGRAAELGARVALIEKNEKKGVEDENVKKKNDYDLSIRIAERIKSKLKLSSDQDSLDFLQTLLKDYNFYTTQ